MARRKRYVVGFYVDGVYHAASADAGAKGEAIEIVKARQAARDGTEVITGHRAKLASAC